MFDHLEMTEEKYKNTIYEHVTCGAPDMGAQASRLRER